MTPAGRRPARRAEPDGRGPGEGTATVEVVETVDVVVVGSGAAGMTAALTAARNGLRALVVEKAPRFGGSTARSGGGVWIPGNDVLRRAGVPDSPEAASTYLAHIVREAGTGDPGEAAADGAVAGRRQRAFLEHGPAALRLVTEETPLRFRWVPGYCDYYPEAPGGLAAGRSVEPVPLDAGVLGEERADLNGPYAAGPGGMAITAADYRWLNLLARHPRGPLTAARLAVRHLAARARGRELLAMGQALAAGLRAGLRGAGVPVWLATPLLDLHTSDGRVTGVRVRRRGAEVVVRARYGAVLASGGFDHNEQLRRRYQREPISTAWTAGADENTGDGILAGLRLGAATDLMDEAWWGPSIPLRNRSYFCLAERTLPGSLMVNARGERFVNEAAPYVDAVHAMYGPPGAASNMPTWLIADQRYRNRYVFAGLGPRQPLPGRWYDAGAVHRADTVADLARRIDVPADALAHTVARFNGFARTGHDEDFGRGDSAYDRYYGDPRNRPNPCLAPLLRPPFYAIRLVPGDLGTKGGLVTDEHARVLRGDGAPVPGLYAAGNASAAVMGRTYAGPGATIGPAMVFGYLAALHVARAAGTAAAADETAGATTHGGMR